MVGAYLIDPDRGPFDLKTLCKKWLSHDMTRYEEVAGKAARLLFLRSLTAA